MRLVRILTLSLIPVLLLCTVAWLSPLPAQESPQTLNLTFTTIDVPGALYTVPWAINTSGDIVGNYGQFTDSHGFLYSNGTFTYFDYPGETVTVPTDINDSGLIVGYAGSGNVFGFLYDGANFTTFTDGGNSATFSRGINNAGEIVGGAGSIYATTGFALLGGRFKALNVPGVNVYVEGSKVNNLGTIVGFTSGESHGFLCRRGTCQTFDFPGATQTTALGINDAGLIVGWYGSPACLECGFVSKNGRYLSFSYPGAAGTTAGGINASGQIVGQYTFDYSTWHGYVTNPITDADFSRN